MNKQTDTEEIDIYFYIGIACLSLIIFLGFPLLKNNFQIVMDFWFQWEELIVSDTKIDDSVEADAKRMRWILNGNGFFMEEKGICACGPCDKEEQDKARYKIDQEIERLSGHSSGWQSADFRGLRSGVRIPLARDIVWGNERNGVDAMDSDKAQVYPCGEGSHKIN